MIFYLGTSFMIFLIGSFGIFFYRKNIIIILICLELLLLASSINFVMFSIYIDDIVGQIFCLLVLTVGAAESAIGLAILVTHFRLRRSIDINLFDSKRK